MSKINWLDVETFEDEPTAFAARVVNLAQAAITIATVSSITTRVYLCTSRDNVIAGIGTLVGSPITETVASVVYDTMQPWSKDSTGYNLKIEPDADVYFASGGWHRIESIVTPSTGQPFPVVWGKESRELMTS